MAKQDFSNKLKFYGFDARLSVLLLVNLFVQSMTLFYTLFGLAGLLFVLERNGWHLDMFARKVWGSLSGSRKLARPWWRTERFLRKG